MCVPGRSVCAVLRAFLFCVSQLVAGVATSAAFGVGAFWTASLGSSPEEARRHETGHQMSAFASVLFAGAMGYRASANPYVGPGGNMLAALGVASAAYHLAKMHEWQEFSRARASEAERLLAEYRDGLPPQARAAEIGPDASNGSGLPFGLPEVPRGGF